MRGSGKKEKKTQPDSCKPSTRRRLCTLQGQQARSGIEKARDGTAIPRMEAMKNVRDYLLYKPASTKKKERVKSLARDINGLGLRRFLWAAGIGMSLLLGSGVDSRATYTVNIYEDDDAVYAIGSGTVDLTQLYNFGQWDSGPMFGPSTALFAPSPVSYDLYGGGSISGPTSYPAGDIPAPTSSSGEGAGIWGANMLLLIPTSYSGGSLSFTLSWQGESFSSLGLSEGTNTWTWGSDEHADSYTINVVPEPNSLIFVCLGVTALCIWRGFRRENFCLKA